MRRIVVTEEEKKFHKARREEHLLSLKKKKGSCLVCKKMFVISDAFLKSHGGHCSLFCKNRYPYQAVKPVKGLSKKQKKQNKKDEKRRQRQVRRVEKKQTPLEFYASDEWRQLRYRVLRRYNFYCMACGSRPPKVVLHVDHIKPRSKYPHLELDENNLQVLCEACNIGKLNLFEDDLRPKL